MFYPTGKFTQTAPFTQTGAFGKSAIAITDGFTESQSFVGSPLFTRSSSFSNRRIAISVTVVRRPTSTNGNESQSNGLSAGTFVGIGLGIFALIAGLLVFLILWRRRAKAEEPELDSDVEKPPDEAMTYDEVEDGVYTNPLENSGSQGENLDDMSFSNIETDESV